jgi:hypothetical protein
MQLAGFASPAEPIWYRSANFSGERSGDAHAGIDADPFAAAVAGARNRSRTASALPIRACPLWVDCSGRDWLPLPPLMVESGPVVASFLSRNSSFEALVRELNRVGCKQVFREAATLGE